jgi:hypothetical protein
MNMKDLKMYEAPASEVVELEAKAVLLAGSGETNAEDVEVTPPAGEL